MNKFKLDNIPSSFYFNSFNNDGGRNFGQQIGLSANIPNF